MFGGYIRKNDAKGDSEFAHYWNSHSIRVNSTAECLSEDMYDMPSQLGSYLQVMITMLYIITYSMQVVTSMVMKSIQTCGFTIL